MDDFGNECEGFGHACMKLVVHVKDLHTHVCFETCDGDCIHGSWRYTLEWKIWVVFKVIKSC